MRAGAGQRDRYCVLERCTYTQNGFGEKVETWEQFAEVWASREIKKGDEEHNARQTHATRQIVYIIDDYPGIDQVGDTKMRLIEGGVTYGVRSIAELGRGEGYEIEVAFPV